MERLLFLIEKHYDEEIKTFLFSKNDHHEVCREDTYEAFTENESETVEIAPFLTGKALKQ